MTGRARWANPSVTPSHTGRGRSGNVQTNRNAAVSRAANGISDSPSLANRNAHGDSANAAPAPSATMREPASASASRVVTSTLATNASTAGTSVAVGWVPKIANASASSAGTSGCPASSG